MTLKKGLYYEYKYIIGLFLIIIVLFLNIISVYAKTLTINEINDEFKISFIDELSEYGINLSSSVNSENKTFNVYNSDSEKIATFKYTDEYIEYDNRNATITEETIMNEISSILTVEGIIISILNLSGYSDKTIQDEEEIDFTNTYDTYGIQIETEHYEFIEEGDNGNWHMEGDYIKYFKMSFDTNKIDALMNKYGVDESDQDLEEVILNLTPTLIVKEITQNSVTLQPHIPYTNTDPDYKVYCYVYRSNSKDGNYEKVLDTPVNCLGDSEIIDNRLMSNTTYYYKTVVTNGTNYSDVLEVTTKNATTKEEDDSHKNNKENISANPQTGTYLYAATILIMLVSSIFALVYIKKTSLKNLIK